MEQQFDEDTAESIDQAAERYWLQGYPIAYAKRRALAEVTRQEMPQPVTMFPVVQLG